jgi:hypothetical protein
MYVITWVVTVHSVIKWVDARNHAHAVHVAASFSRHARQSLITSSRVVQAKRNRSQFVQGSIGT